MIVDILACGGVINKPREIKLPTLQDPRTNKVTYASALNCVWNITAPKDQNVVVR